jgi:hypothetical protein
MDTQEIFDIWKIENTSWCRLCDGLLFKPLNASERWFWEHFEKCDGDI